jgi:hypothetical protein
MASDDNNPKTLDLPRQIVCEGDADVAFLDQLLTARGARDAFQLRQAKGKDGIATELRAMRALRGWSDVRLLLIVVDNDDDPVAGLDAVKKHIRTAMGADTSLPGTAFALTAGAPAIGIITLPGTNQPGCLETLLYEIAFRAPHGETARACVAALHECAGVGAWSHSQQAKMRWHALVACVNRTDPTRPARWLLRRQPDAFDFQHSALAPLAQFLASVP